MQSESHPQNPLSSKASTSHSTPPPCCATARCAALSLAGLAIIAFAFLNLQPVEGRGDAADDVKPPTPTGPVPFATWGTVKPDLAIVITGQMHGYIQPCGCSSPQYGGLARRYNFIQSLKDKGWPVVALDVGELPPAHGVQAELKYAVTMKALRLMGYNAVGLGKYEFNMPTVQALANYSVNNPVPTPVASNLKSVPKGPDFYGMNVRPFKVIDTTSPRLGIVAIADAECTLNVSDKDCAFTPPAASLAAAVKEARANKAEVNILLYQGTDVTVEKLMADFAALRGRDKSVPAVPIVISLSAASEPPSRASTSKNGGAQVITVGHKGRYVGVVGLFKQPNGNYHLKYELVAMGPQFQDPRNPVSALMEQYSAEVQRRNLITMFPRGPHPLEIELRNLKLTTHYVGSEICGNCHPHAYNVWSKAGLNPNEKSHFNAFSALVKADNPKLRQFDGECVACHTIGFAYNTGYMDRANNPKMNAKLLNVGCESCHGPAAAHVNNPQNTALYPLINPLSTRRIPAKANTATLKANFIATQRRNQDDFCQKCHDNENDVHWGIEPYLKKWAQIDHMTPPPGNVIAPVPVVPVPPIRVETEK